MDIKNNINNDIKFLAKSEIRLKILSELDKHPDNVRGLVKKTSIAYSSVSSNIGKLENHNYITKIENKYHINPMTQVYFKTLMDFKNSVELVNTYDAFWNKHNLNQLSITSVKRITDLKNSELIETTPIDIYKTHNTIKNQIMDSKNVRAIFPYLHPEYPNLIEGVLKNDGSVELIVPKSIFKELLFRVNNDVRRKAIRDKKLRVYSFEKDLNLYLTICDENMSLGLFKNDGSFDQNRVLVSNDKQSYNWAEELFNHVKKQVKK
ncbi:winged helix-turn-helix domain-containing protein [uncultured Methanobrevibacter sp.]|uniref:helix-turn-helix transcriptional regulator n=1 Tax=uncultured Methanobrevibacter sp. TaxID=253161 RepID=UPI0025D8B611|nr:transcriptional regulator FilR1 domain-containing protein [uncultured Methanobrevibacter sp.]